MARPIQHLAQVVALTGRPNGTDEIMAVIEAGVRNLNEQDKAERIRAKGTALKSNPHISDAGKCPRRVVLSLLNIEETNPPDTDALIRFMVGHAFEDALARIFTAYQGATYIREESVRIECCGVVISGRKDFDAVRVATSDAIIELKSTNPRSMAFLLKRGTPNDEHISQLNLYLEAAEKPFGYLVYGVMGSTKGEPILHAWKVPYDAERAAKDKQALVDAQWSAIRGELPSIPEAYKASTFPCSYCSHKNACWKPDTNVEAMLSKSLEIARGTV
jgi:hypothetical protein